MKTTPNTPDKKTIKWGVCGSSFNESWVVEQFAHTMEHYRQELEKEPWSDRAITEEVRAVGPDPTARDAVLFSSKYRTESKPTILREVWRASPKGCGEPPVFLLQAVDEEFDKYRLLPEKPDFKVLLRSDLGIKDRELAQKIIDKKLPYFVSRESDDWLPKTDGEDLEYRGWIYLVSGKKITFDSILANIDTLRFSAEEIIQSSEAIPVSVSKELPTRQLIPFSAMSDLRWDEVTITFVDNDSVRIQARDRVETVLYVDLGLRDGRIGNLPTKAWDFLRVLAENGGEIKWNSPHSNVKYKIRVKELRKTLRACFGIKADPFYPYKKCRSYKPRFSLKDKS